MDHNDSDLKTRLVIPKTLRNQVKKILHKDHRQDLTRVKKRAQEHVYWPMMNSDLKSFMLQKLLRFQRPQPKV